MRRSAAVAFLLVLTACAGMTPSKTWALQRDGLTAANTAFVAASQAGRLKGERLVYYGELLQAARKSLAQAEALLPAGGPTFDSYMAIVQAVMTKAAEGVK